VALLAVVLVVASVGVVPGTAVVEEHGQSVVAAEPGPSPMNFSVTWRANGSENPQAPGAENVRMWAFARGFPVDLTPLGNITAVAPGGQGRTCGFLSETFGPPETFGIDRNGDDGSDTGDDRPTYIDLTLRDSVRSQENFTISGQYVTWVNLYDEGDGGDFRPGDVDVFQRDEIVLQMSKCFTQPVEPGWYRWYGHINGSKDGVTRDTDGGDWRAEEWWGDNPEDRAATYSHWYYVCNCSNRTEAERTLGLPPDYHPHRSRSVRAPNYERGMNLTLYAPGDRDRLPPPVPTETETLAPMETATPSSTPSPSPGESPGFGTVAMLLAVGVALVGLRRRA